MGLRLDEVLVDLVKRGMKVRGEKIVQASVVDGLESVNVVVTTCERREFNEGENRDWYEDSEGYVRLWVVVEGYGEKGRYGSFKPFESSKGNASDHVSIDTFIKRGFRKDLF